MSLRAIAKAAGQSYGTTQRQLFKNETVDQPDKVTGLDGKERRRPTLNCGITPQLTTRRDNLHTDRTRQASAEHGGYSLDASSLAAKEGYSSQQTTQPLRRGSNPNAHNVERRRPRPLVPAHRQRVGTIATRAHPTGKGAATPPTSHRPARLFCWPHA